MKPIKTLVQDKELRMEYVAPYYSEDITGFLHEISLWAIDMEHKQNEIISALNILIDKHE